MLQRSTRFSTLLGLAGLLAMTCSPSASYGQRPGQGGQSGQSGRSQVSSAFNRSSPGIGESIPEVTVYTADGKKFSTSQLKGSYTVLVFGCLT